MIQPQIMEIGLIWLALAMTQETTGNSIRKNKPTNTTPTEVTGTYGVHNH